MLSDASLPARRIVPSVYSGGGSCYCKEVNLRSAPVHTLRWHSASKSLPSVVIPLGLFTHAGFDVNPDVGLVYRDHSHGYHNTFPATDISRLSVETR